MGCSGSSATRVITPGFIWGATGSVLIKSMKLILEFNPVQNSIITRVPNTRVTESLLTWKNRVFTLQDLFINDVSEGKRFKCPDIKINFTISEYDQFSKILDPDSLIETIKATQHKNLDQTGRMMLISNLEKECKEFWSFIKDFWVKHKTLAQKTEVVNFDRECLSHVVEKKSDPDRIREFLVNKYKATSFGKLKRDVKAKIIMEKADFKPHIVKIRKSNIVDFMVGSQHLLEVLEDVRVIIFCWDNIPQLNEVDYLQSEMKKMQSGTKVVYKDLEQIINTL